MTIMRRICLAAIFTVALAACGDASADDASGVATLSGQPTADPTPTAPASEAADVAASDDATTDDSGGGATAEAADETDEVVEEEVDAEAQLLAFASCMRDEGIDMDDPTIDGDGNPQLAPPTGFDFTDASARDQIIAARDACAIHLEGVGLGFAGQQDTGQQDQLLEFSQCMRDNGYDMPDIELGGPGGPRGLDDIDQDDPAFQQAQDVCQDILAGFGPGAGASEG